MMSEYEYDIPMPENYRQLLLKLVNQSRELSTLTASYFFTLDGSINIRMGHGEGGWRTDQISGDPILSFDCFGLVKIYGDQNEHFTGFTLTAKTFKWANYEKKTPIGKWFAKYNVKDFVIGIAFVLSVGLTIVQILQALRVIPTPGP